MPKPNLSDFFTDSTKARKLEVERLSPGSACQAFVHELQEGKWYVSFRAVVAIMESEQASVPRKSVEGRCSVKEHVGKRLEMVRVYESSRSSECHWGEELEEGWHIERWRESKKKCKEEYTEGGREREIWLENWSEQIPKVREEQRKKEKL